MCFFPVRETVPLSVYRVFFYGKQSKGADYEVSSCINIWVACFSHNQILAKSTSEQCSEHDVRTEAAVGLQLAVLLGSRWQ